MSIKVTTQAELNKALKDPSDFYIDIVSPRGIWLEISDSKDKVVTASASATVTAYGSATVTASDSATVTAYGSATVRASDSATVTAYGSATVRASGSVAVHLFSARAKVEGGVIIDVTNLDLSDPEQWANYHGAAIEGDEIIVYKAVDKNLKSNRNFEYPIGEHVEAKDWEPGDFCGNGLHFSPWPHQALDYFNEATRFLKVAVKISELTIIDGNHGGTPKLKAKGGRVLNEVTIDAQDM
jgi:hypothetical protein